MLPMLPGLNQGLISVVLSVLARSAKDTQVPKTKSPSLYACSTGPSILHGAYARESRSFSARQHLRQANKSCFCLQQKD